MQRFRRGEPLYKHSVLRGFLVVRRRGSISARIAFRGSKGAFENLLARNRNRCSRRPQQESASRGSSQTSVPAHEPDTCSRNNVHLTLLPLFSSHVNGLVEPAVARAEKFFWRPFSTNVVDDAFPCATSKRIFVRSKSANWKQHVRNVTGTAVYRWH